MRKEICSFLSRKSQLQYFLQPGTETNSVLKVNLTNCLISPRFNSVQVVHFDFLCNGSTRASTNCSVRISSKKNVGQAFCGISLAIGGFFFQVLITSSSKLSESESCYKITKLFFFSGNYEATFTRYISRQALLIISPCLHQKIFRDLNLFQPIKNCH